MLRDDASLLDIYQAGQSLVEYGEQPYALFRITGTNEAI